MNKLFKFAFLIIAVVFISGCGKKENSKEIEFLTNRTDYVNGTTNAAGIKDPNTAYYKILADKFKKETGIKVKLSAYNDYPNAMRRRLTSNNIGDVITLPDNNFPTETITTFFQPIGTKEQLSDYLFLDNCADGNNVYGLSASYYISGCIYNKKTFAEAGYKEFPKTLDELHDAFAKIKANGKIPVILNRANSILGQTKTMVPSFSGNAYAFNKMWSVDKPFSKEYPFGRMIYEICYWTSKGWVEPEFINDWEGSKTKVASGEAGMMFLGSWGFPQVKNRTASIKGANPDDIAFAAFPICSPYIEKQYIQAGPGNPMVISKKTKNFEACKKWIDYIIDSGMEKAGHKNIDIIAATHSNEIIKARLGAAENYASKYQFEYNIYNKTVPGFDYEIDYAGALASEIYRDKMPDAIFVPTVPAAMGVQRKLRDLGYNAGENYSLVSCEDYHIAANCIPAVTITYTPDITSYIKELIDNHRNNNIEKLLYKADSPELFKGESICKSCRLNDNACNT